MARGKRTRSIRELRDEYDAAERRERGDEDLDDEDLDEEDEDMDDEDELDDEIEDEEEEEVPKKKPKRKAAAKPRTRRTRAAKVQRMKVVWGVFDNSHKCVATYEYKKKDEALAHAEKLTASKSNNTHFIQPVKEPLEEKE